MPVAFARASKSTRGENGRCTLRAVSSIIRSKAARNKPCLLPNHAWSYFVLAPFGVAIPTVLTLFPDVAVTITDGVDGAGHDGRR